MKDYSKLLYNQNLSKSVSVENYRERIIGENHLMDINFLSKGLQVARTVGRIVFFDNGRIKGRGTGFLVAPNILMTNNHVIESKYCAEKLQVEFEYEKNKNGTINETFRFKFNPGNFFITNEDLDYTLVAVEPIAINDPRKKLKEYGYNKLVSLDLANIIDLRVNIIQHPRGYPKMIAFRENKITKVEKEYIEYSTDTEPGSSGSLVANDKWQIIALHSEGVPSKDEHGNLLSRKGNILPSDVDDHMVHWIANKGTLINAVLKDVYRRRKLPKIFEQYINQILVGYKSDYKEYKLPESRNG